MEVSRIGVLTSDVTYKFRIFLIIVAVLFSTNITFVSRSGAGVSDSTIFAFTLDGSQTNSCAGNGSDRSGFAICVLNSDSSQLSIHIEHDIDIVDLIGGHVHFAPECGNGFIVFPLGALDSPIDINWAIDATNLQRLIDGELYMNFHTVANSFEEIRGQVLKNQGCCITSGDADNNGSFNIADVTFGIARIFAGGPAPFCQDEADANGDNSFNIADVTFGIARIFASGLAPVCGGAGI
ncbi:CHRD domain-containing protein [bacterium AH-315-J21]|nr:CHRD domain-containing protein [bacterium AH-315-J21]